MYDEPELIVADDGLVSINIPLLTVRSFIITSENNPADGFGVILVTIQGMFVMRSCIGFTEAAAYAMRIVQNEYGKTDVPLKKESLWQ